MGKSPKLFYYGYRPGGQFGIFGRPTMVSEAVLPKSTRRDLQGVELPEDIRSGSKLDIIFKKHRILANCYIFSAAESPLPSHSLLLHHWFYQEGRFLVFLYNGKRVWALRSELSVIR